MKKLAIVLMLLVLGSAPAFAQTNVTVDPATFTFGYMNVFDLAWNFQFGSSWGTADLVAYFTGAEATLAPNTIGDPNEYWYQCLPGNPGPDCGEPGAPGNKIMEAVFHAQIDDGSLSGVEVVFSGNVISNSFTEHTVKAFVRDFAPDYSSVVESVIPLDSTGYFSVSLNTINDPARHVQYGFITTGVNVWVTDTEPFGTMVVGPDQAVANEEATWGGIKSIYR